MYQSFSRCHFTLKMLLTSNTDIPVHLHFTFTSTHLISISVFIIHLSSPTSPGTVTLAPYLSFFLSSLHTHMSSPCLCHFSHSALCHLHIILTNIVLHSAFEK